jgi:hypothetical protein
MVRRPWQAIEYTSTISVTDNIGRSFSGINTGRTGWAISLDPADMTDAAIVSRYGLGGYQNLVIHPARFPAFDGLGNAIWSRSFRASSVNLSGDLVIGGIPEGPGGWAGLDIPASFGISNIADGASHYAIPFVPPGWACDGVPPLPGESYVFESTPESWRSTSVSVILNPPPTQSLITTTIIEYDHAPIATIPDFIGDDGGFRCRDSGPPGVQADQAGLREIEAYMADDPLARCRGCGQ